ncbi:MAG: hypothetical protein AB1758_30630 [Candidatus Eremiobacterota bacterium]
MRIHCPDCGGEVPASEVNVQALLAKCVPCDRLFSFAEAPAVAERERPPVPRPASVAVNSTGEVMTLSRRWFHWGLIFLTFFCVVWDGFLLFWYGMALTQRNVPWIALVFPLGHLAVGVFLTYTTLAGYLNSTVVTVTRQSISIQHGPLPWPGNQTISLSDVDQLYCEEIRGSKGSRTYNLNALMRDQRQLKLLTGLDQADVGRYLEQQIERWLGIQDRPVLGELPR